MLKVSISLVDGGAQEWTEDDSFYSRLQSLRRTGLQDKALIDALISDDWGAPPKWVTISGRLKDGQVVNESIRYA